MTLNQRIGNRISELLKSHGLKQVDLVDEDLKKAHISHIINGHSGISLSTLETICSKLNVSLAEFFQPFSENTVIIPTYTQELSSLYNDLTYEDIQTLVTMAKRMKAIRQEVSVNSAAANHSMSVTSDETLYPVHILGEAAAGLPLYDEAFPDEFVDLPAKYADPDHYRIIRARGDSMEPKIHSGDIVVAEIDVEPFDGQMALVFLAGLADDEYTIKRVYKEHGKAILRSYNSNYPDMIYDLTAVRSWERVVKVVPGSRK